MWPEPWVLPFDIKTLGNLKRQVSAKDAAVNWPIAKRRMAETQNRGGISAAMHITGTTVFVPVEITEDDWERICCDLST